MPVYSVQGPDGRTYSIEGPEGATADQLGQFIMQDKQARLAAQQEADRKLYAPTGSAYENFMAGAGKAVADTGLGLQQLVAPVQDYLSPRKGQPSRSEQLAAEYSQRKQLDAPLMDTTAGTLGNVSGNLATTLLPGGAGLAAGKVLSKVPNAVRMAEALQTGGKALMAPTNIPTALTVGAAQGAVQPAETGSERLANMGIGSVASAAVPAAIRTGQTVKALVDPFTEAGQRQIVGRALNQAAGSPESAALMRSNIQAATAPFVGPVPEGELARTMMGEIVPGSIPTTAQVAGVPSIAALSRATGTMDSQGINALSDRMAAQNAARYRQVENIAGSTGGRDFAAANRSVVGNDLYGQARLQGIDPAALTPEAQANIAAFQSRVPDEIMNRARELAKINGVNMDNESSVQGLHWIKTAIDDKIANAARQGDTQLKNAYQGLQSNLLSGMDELSPAYGEARRTFAEMSKPINEMDVAQDILNRSTGNSVARATSNPELNVQTVRPSAFQTALSDETAARVVRPGATLENTMQPRNLQKLEAVNADLQRANFAQTAGKEMGGSDTAQKLAFANLAQQSGMPSWINPQLALTAAGTGIGSLLGPVGAGSGAAIGALTKAGARAAYQDANQEMNRKLAQALLDPQMASQLMDAGLINPTIQALLQRGSQTGSAIGMATPALLNSIRSGGD
jgi:hypothetical protein